VKRKHNENLRSYLKRFQTMRNKIPNIVDDVVIDDFCCGSCDEDLVKELLKTLPLTAKQLFRDTDRYITAVEQALDLVDKRRDVRPKEKQEKAEDTPWQDHRWEKRPCIEEVNAMGPLATRPRGNPRGSFRNREE